MYSHKLGERGFLLEKYSGENINLSVTSANKNWFVFQTLNSV